ncbi:MAG: flavodoxin-dependent (E)-4-hydroxy-3-methylbut-2-enyl-diphosphate synthase [bacterium]
MKIKRRKTRKIFVGNVAIGGRAPVSVQSMTKTQTTDVEATVAQILALTAEGCEIVRVAVPDEGSAAVLPEIRSHINIPLIADIHFSKKLAFKVMEAGVDGLRINPGNISAEKELKEIFREAEKSKTAVRIGVNAGSLDRNLLKKYKHPTAGALVESAMRVVRIAERCGFESLKLSLKASDVLTTIEAYRKVSQKLDYPLHIGVTEAGGLRSGSVRSSVGLGILLAEGIGDTLRVSLAADPVEEVKVGWEILGSLGIRQRGPIVIACPTCGRCGVDLFKVVKEIEERIKAVNVPIKVAVMGCVVNGPGEAKEADFGIALGRGGGLIFHKGEIVGKAKADHLAGELLGKIFKYVEDKEKNAVKTRQNMLITRSCRKKIV